MDVIKIKRTTANLPSDLLNEAIKVTGKGITETLIDGLLMIKRSSAFAKAQALKGKLKLEIDIKESRRK